MSTTTNHARAFDAELADVQTLLLDAANELGSPLGEVVHSRIRRSAPLLRAAVILTVATGDDEALRSRRILLAGALEMLRVAMHVHRLLLAPANAGARNGHDESQDRTFMGGAILAGDYCFSRAAQMAARTDNPKVVRIFSRTLQVVSEEQLRHHFAPSGEFDENETLLLAGAEAAAALAGLDETATTQALAYSAYIAARAQRRMLTPVAELPAPALTPRGMAVQEWLEQNLNGSQA